MAECPVTPVRPADVSAASLAYKRLDSARWLPIEERAAAFLDLLAAEEGGPGVSPERRREVAADIAAKGHYEHTEEELLWGCRFAWRHTTRCIGRYFWRQLEVRDARKAA